MYQETTKELSKQTHRKGDIEREMSNAAKKGMSKRHIERDIFKEAMEQISKSTLKQGCMKK